MGTLPALISGMRSTTTDRLACHRAYISPDVVPLGCPVKGENMTIRLSVGELAERIIRIAADAPKAKLPKPRSLTYVKKGEDK